MPSFDPLPNPLRDEPPSSRPTSDRPRPNVSSPDPVQASSPRAEKRPASRFRFSVASLFAAMFLASVVAAGASYYVRFLRGNESAKFAFTLFTLASPVLLMILVSLAASFMPRRKRRR
jgi:FtsH-binding integral membrane protein